MSQTAPLHTSSALHSTVLPAGYVLVPPPDYILVPLTGMCVIIAGALLAAFFSARLKRAATAQAVEILSKSARLADQIGALSTALAAIDARLATLAGRFDEQSHSTQAGAATSYSVAIRMARGGASRQDLMMTCGVTQQEADLVLRLHGSEQTSRTAA